MKRQLTAARRDLLMLLRRGGPQTVDSLSSQMGITPVGVRKHLDTLEIDGLVQAATQRRAVGRPVQIYSLTDAANELFPQAYDAVLASILRQVQQVGGEALLQQVLDGRIEEAEAKYQRLTDGKPLQQQIESLTDARNEAGYIAECSRDGQDYILKEHHCALCRVVAEFPQFCECELELFQRLLGGSAVVERVEHRLDGDCTCTYRICERQTASAKKELVSALA